jgi:hypothetical protein
VLPVYCSRDICLGEFTDVEIVRAEGVGMDVEVITIMYFQHFDEKMGRRVLVKVVGEITEPDLPALG